MSDCNYNNYYNNGRYDDNPGCGDINKKLDQSQIGNNVMYFQSYFFGTKKIYLFNLNLFRIGRYGIIIVGYR